MALQSKGSVARVVIKRHGVLEVRLGRNHKVQHLLGGSREGCSQPSLARPAPSSGSEAERGGAFPMQKGKAPVWPARWIRFWI